MLISATAPIYFMLILLVSLSISVFLFLFFCRRALRSRLRSNNGLSVSQHYGFITAIWVNQPIKMLSGLNSLFKLPLSLQQGPDKIFEGCSGGFGAHGWAREAELKRQKSRRDF